MAEEIAPSEDVPLTEDEKKTLHQIARAAIEKQLGNKTDPPKTASKTLKEKRGAFVSLHSHDRLRGCIGYVHGVKPLADTISDMAVAAAFQDPRFSPVKKDELPDLDIEISVLTPMRKIDDINEIEVGKHGLMMIKGACSGLLLPQVATQYHWDRDTFLAQTCNKAGLPSNAWQDRNTEIYIFSAQVF